MRIKIILIAVFLICINAASAPKGVMYSPNDRVALLSYPQSPGGPMENAAFTVSPTTNPVSSSRRINWTNAGVQGGIPARNIQCGSTIAAYSGAATTINNAISSCTSGDYVSLGAGTFNLSSGITFGTTNNVTLRGAGPDQTFLVFTGDTSCNGLGADICIAGSNSWQGGPQNTANWTAGYAPGTTSITLSNITNLVPGSSIIVLDQLDDSSDNGNLFVCA